MDGNASSSDSEDERAEHSRDIQGGHVLVVRKDTAGRGEIHLTMRNSRFPASHAGGAMNHAAGSADRGEHRDIAAAREFRERSRSASREFREGSAMSRARSWRPL